MALFGKSDINKLAEHSGLTIFNVSDRLYLFKPHDDTRTCIISAHGGRATRNASTFRVPPDTILRFYAEDTFSVLDPGFSEFYTKEAVPREILSEGDECFDYCLTKYQGRHNSANETYSSIAQTISAAFKSREIGEAQLKSAIAKNAPEKTKRALGAVVARNKTPAVVTVRNRTFRAELTLSEVIAMVKTAAPEMTLFDCSFCRSVARGGSQAVALVER
jgi:hypothetical protein